MGGAPPWPCPDATLRTRGTRPPGVDLGREGGKRELRQPKIIAGLPCPLAAAPLLAFSASPARGNDGLEGRKKERAPRRGGGGLGCFPVEQP